MKKATAKKAKTQGAFGGLGDMLSVGGLDDIIAATGAGKPTFSYIEHSDVQLWLQQRSAQEMETDEQTIAELAENIKAHGVLQPVVLSSLPDGSWRMVCGERRFRANGLAGNTTIPAMCYEGLTEDQITAIQFAENIHRLNLSQINEARVLAGDIERLGSIEAVCEAHNKSRSWVSKRLTLLELPPETARLLTENVTADLEVISSVKQIEKVDKAAAAAVVTELKANRGKKGVNARDTVKNAKDKVKPPKTEKPKGKGGATSDNLALPLERPGTEPGPVRDIDPADMEDGAAGDVAPLAPVAALDKAYVRISTGERSPKQALSDMPAKEREDVTLWLNGFYEAGIECKGLAAAVIKGFQSGSFATSGHGALALAAFLSGGEDGVRFNALDILGCVKA